MDRKRTDRIEDEFMMGPIHRANLTPRLTGAGESDGYDVNLVWVDEVYPWHDSLPAVARLLAAAQEYVAALDHQVNVFTREIDGEHLASIDASIRVGESLDALRAELAAATAGPAALTTDDAELGVSVRRLCELYSAVAEAIDRGFSPVAFARIRATFAEFTEHDANLISDAFGIYSDN